VDRERPSRRWKRVVWISGSILTLVVVLVLIRLGYAHRATGFGQYKVNGEVQPFKTLWDWLDLLIVPIVLAIGGYLFTRSESQRTQEAADQQRTLDRELADERRQDDMLQAYLDGMSELLSDEKRPLHRAERGDRLSTVARARTLTVLRRLDGERKGNVVQFLSESGLITKDSLILDLNKCDLSGANVSFVNLSKAYLFWTTLKGANMSGAILKGANMSRANMSGASGITNEELEQQAHSLKGATMPNGQKYEDWLEDQ
jgi:uncharacterized membrane protein